MQYNIETTTPRCVNTRARSICNGAPTHVRYVEGGLVVGVVVVAVVINIGPKYPNAFDFLISTDATDAICQ